MIERMRKTVKCSRDLDMLMSLAKDGEGMDMDISSRDKGSMLYELEAEEIDLKDLGANA
jgi:hypothetical protein